MGEWWTYRPSDFLMYSGRSWQRLVAAWNGDLWPWQLVLLAAALALVVAIARREERHAWLLAPALAPAWLLVGWAFLWQRYAAIDTSGPWLAAAWGVQALLLAALGWRTAGPPSPLAWTTGLLLAVVAVAGPAVVDAWTRQPLAQAAWAGSMPGPTALLTVGLLLAAPVRHRGVLLVVPVLAVAHAGLQRWLLAG